MFNNNDDAIFNSDKLQLPNCNKALHHNNRLVNKSFINDPLVGDSLDPLFDSKLVAQKILSENIFNQTTNNIPSLYVDPSEMFTSNIQYESTELALNVLNISRAEYNSMTTIELSRYINIGYNKSTHAINILIYYKKNNMLGNNIFNN